VMLATNHLGPFLLTNLLRDQLVGAAGVARSTRRLRHTGLAR